MPIVNLEIVAILRVNENHVMRKRRLDMAENMNAKTDGLLSRCRN